VWERRAHATMENVDARKGNALHVVDVCGRMSPVQVVVHAVATVQSIQRMTKTRKQWGSREWGCMGESLMSLSCLQPVGPRQR
jgi:hypothetical protein